MIGTHDDVYADVEMAGGWNASDDGERSSMVVATRRAAVSRNICCPLLMVWLVNES